MGDLDWCHPLLLPLAGGGSSSSVLRKLQLSEPRIKNNTETSLKKETPLEEEPPSPAVDADPYFNIHLGALGLLRGFGLGMLAELGDVLHHL